MEKQWFKTREVAHVLSLTDRTIRQWIKDGKLPAVKVGSTWRVSKDTLNEIISVEQGE